MMASQFPKPTEEMWRNIATKFWEKWNFPNCIGAIDGKHVTLVSPANSGSLYFNYKGTFSIVLLALADAEYRFTFLQVGDFGRTSDGGVYSGSALGRAMEAKKLSVPADCALPGSGAQGLMPYTMVVDGVFPLKTHLIRPFPGKQIPKWHRIFNYRLSRARMVIECAFGILSSRWRVLHTKMNVNPSNADSVVTAACILHNYLLNPSENQCGWRSQKKEGKCFQMSEIWGATGDAGKPTTYV